MYVWWLCNGWMRTCAFSFTCVNSQFFFSIREAKGRLDLKIFLKNLWMQQWILIKSSVGIKQEPNASTWTAGNCKQSLWPTHNCFANNKVRNVIDWHVNFSTWERKITSWKIKKNNPKTKIGCDLEWNVFAKHAENLRTF